MPATESTWRDQKFLHVVFGVTSVLMLITTVWMLAADHRREWKDYQRDFRNVEAWTAQSRVSEVETDPKYRETLKDYEEKLLKAQQEVPSSDLIGAFEESVRKDAKRRQVEEPDFKKLEATYTSLEKADKEDRPGWRSALLDQLNDFARKAKFREDNALTAKKFKAADFDVARSEYELGVGNGMPAEKLTTIQERVEKVKGQLSELSQEVQAATAHRKLLERIIGDMTADEAAAKKDVDDQKQKLKRLQDVVMERQWTYSKDALSLPIVDAFGRPLKIDQIWLPKLTINNNFRDIARFDRCTTCHQGIDKTAPGSAISAGYRHQETVEVKLATPTDPPPMEEGADASARLRQLYGMELEDRSLLNDVTAAVSIVTPESPAAKSGFVVGDVIVAIGGTPVVDKARALAFLTEVSQWGKPIIVTVRRGVPNPFASHPRLDLFVGSLSPHKMQEVGCSICHEGQGSATQFKYASHSPSTPMQEEEWKREHGWFNNHHWIFPMAPKRFAESTCLKCHHEVEALEASEKFPETPAPKVVEGYHLIRQVGCFGCHEINGWDGPNRRIGPDLRTEPNYAAAAQALKFSGILNEQEKGWAEDITFHPDDASARHSLLASLRAEGFPDAEKQEEEPRVSPVMRKLVNVLDDVDSPGKLRKVGPSLRHVASKVDSTWLYSWIRKPTDFRPDTKMPQFFGLHDHLVGESKEETEDFENIEIRGIVAYLSGKSQPFDYLGQPKDVTERPSAERGKKLFETRGCLACHQHSDFPNAKMNQGPNLSHVGAKFGSEGNRDGGKWLYTWLRNPNLYHPRTFMPNLILDPIKGADDKVSDPAADITVFLLGSGADWSPKDVPAATLNGEEEKALYDLALENLKATFSTKIAEKYLEKGIPENMRSELKGDEVELITPMSPEKQLLYVGRRAISKYGCYGCHDVPGYEDAKPIGTGLADWGRKGADKLAFEQITTYLSHPHDAHGEVPESETTASEAHSMNFIDMPPDEGYFMEKLFGHEREGFIWQKLREPRSFDYKKIENKGYNERLRMPKFTVLDEKERESVITFVLGLVNEAPATQYVYHPTPERAAVIEGKRVLEKFNCGGCHTLKMDQWKLAYSPDAFTEASEQIDYDFVKAHASPQQIKESLVTDIRGQRHANLYGMPVLSETDGQPIRYDEDGVPIDSSDPESAGVKGQYSFVLWKDAVINGEVRPAGIQNLLVPEDAVEGKFPADGGYLARLIYPAVFAAEKVLNPNAKPEETWAYLPPPLINEGHKVQSSWLFKFLLDPYPIRPATILRMPKFNMSNADATALVNYFAAVDGAKYPYNYDPRTSASHLDLADDDHPHRFTDALKIVTDGNYCVKCHLVGDYQPTGSERAKGPQLAKVYNRLRPDYLRAWIANPKRILPYTAMPVNIPFDKPVSQALYKGDSIQQLDALVDLLLNFDRFMESKTSIKPLVKTPPPAAASTEK